MRYEDFSSPEFYADPYPFYAQLRSAGAVVNVSPGLWVAGRYKMADALLRDRRMGRAFIQGVRARYGADRAQAYAFGVIERMLVMTNPPEHTRLRAVLMGAFNAKRIHDFRELATQIAEGLIDAIEHRSSVDVVREFSAPLPIAVICRLLDLDIADAAILAPAVSAAAQAFDLAPMTDGQLSAANAAILRLENYFEDVIAARRRKPGSDLISLLISGGPAGETLSDQEIMANTILLFVAGHETTVNMIGNSLIALQQHSEQAQKLRDEPSLWPRAVDELLRYDGSVQMATRAALEDAEIEGVSFKRGDVIFVCLGAANRDPERFDAPDRLKVDRSEHGGRPLTFGGGVHYCLGARLATIEIEVALQTWMRRMPMHMLGNVEQLEWHPRNTLRGVRTLEAVRESAWP